MLKFSDFQLIRVLYLCITIIAAHGILLLTPLFIYAYRWLDTEASFWT